MKFEQSKNPNSKKRKADEDVEKAGPSKVAKTDHPKKSNRLEAKATSSKASGVSYMSYLKLTESLTSPRRILERNGRALILALCSRARLRSRERGGKLTSLTMTWMNQGGKFFSPRSQTSKKIAISVHPTPDTPASPARNFRARVKEFPSGNVATSFSRIAFLRSLCKSPNFNLMVDLIQPVVCLFQKESHFNLLI